MANQVLLHLADPWRAVAEMRRVLGPGGLLSAGAGRLLADLQERAQTGRYFLARTYYTVIATAA
jgi:SAM-dependent methyltransferase